VPLRIRWEIASAPSLPTENDEGPSIQVDLDEIEIRFQPVYSTMTGVTAGYEAFARVPQRMAGNLVLRSIGDALDGPGGSPRIAEIDLACGLAAVRRAQALRLCDGGLLLFLNARPETLAEPKRRHAFAQSMTDGTGISPKQIVLDVTERGPLNDLAGLRKAANALRDAGFKLAIDNFGAGPASLRLLTILEPDIVKIDRQLISNIDHAILRFNLVDSVATACHRMGLKVAACGIEREEELTAVLDMGIELVQGTHLCPPATTPPPAEAGRLTPRGRPGRSLRIRGEPQFIGDIARAVSPIQWSDSIMAAFRRFIDDPRRTSLPVVRQSAAVGMLYRSRFLENCILGRYGYGWALNASKIVGDLMETGSLVVESNATIEGVAQRIRSRIEANLYDDVCVSKTGKYHGVAAVSDLLDAITEKSLNTARNSNPLTGLPGNTAIQREIERRLRQNMHFDACYIDIDNFKPYNDHYGFERGDFVIKTLATIVETALSDPDTVDSIFVGHIGGDDFIVLTRPADSIGAAEKIVAGFAGWLSAFHGVSDYRKGSYVSMRRGGVVATFSLLSLSIGIVSAEVHKVGSYAELASLATEVKKAAKTEEGSSIVRDRRLGGQTAVQHPSD
jgi:EAL domain-containing protein (putative c-di-GMP-specific phosphodiesterase class I)/GGDEF domain-containing protein